MINEFKTVFVITEESYIREPYYLGLLVLIAGIVWLFVQMRKQNKTVNNYFYPFALIIWGLFWFGTSINWQNSYNKSLDNYVSLYNQNKYEIAEGYVEVQCHERKEGHDVGDIIKVAQETFKLSHFTATPLYHESIVYGGVLREGVYVKIYHNDGDILRIDIKDVNPPTGQDGKL